MSEANSPLAASNGAEWAIYWHDEKGLSFGESLYGAFGVYSPGEGYKIDFYPYDMTRDQYLLYINDYMR